MTKREAKQVEAEMVDAGWTGVLLMNAIYTDGTRGWEAVGSEPDTRQSLRMRSVEAWRQWQAKQRPPEAQP